MNIILLKWNVDSIFFNSVAQLKQQVVIKRGLCMCVVSLSGMVSVPGR